MATLAFWPRLRKEGALGLASMTFALASLLACPVKAETIDSHWQSISQEALSENWHNAIQAAEKAPYPVLGKLVAWLYITRTELPVRFETLRKFILKNPGWPVPVETIELTESKMPDDLDPSVVVDWFDKRSPRTARGLDLYLQALGRLKYGEQAAKVLETRWEKIRLTEKELKVLADKYKSLLSEKDHFNRANYMIWNSRYGEAEDVLPYLSKNERLLAEARMALAQDKPGVTKAVNAVPPALQKDEGFLYERLRWRRRHNFDDMAYQLLALEPTRSAQSDKWWQERHILARRAFEKKDYRLAHKIVSGHHLASGLGFSQAEWFLGWLELRFLNQPDQAYKHFTKLYDGVRFPVSQSRAAYWLGRSSEALNRAEEAHMWFQTASEFPTTFYGQKALEKIAFNDNPFTKTPPPVDETSRKAFEADSRVQAIRLLVKAKMRDEAETLFGALLDQAKTPADHVLIARLGKAVRIDSYAVLASKELSQDYNMALLDEGYPLLPPSVRRLRPDPALVHALVRQESLFDPEAESPAGALGLMQLMPSTAKIMAKRLEIPFSKPRLISDPDYNVMLGSGHIDDLLDQYDGSLVLAIAAYNAGAGNVDEWIDLFGDPRTPQADVIDWIEKIPFYETRNYVQRVLEGKYVYERLLTHAGATTPDQG